MQQEYLCRYCTSLCNYILQRKGSARSPSLILPFSSLVRFMISSWSHPGKPLVAIMESILHFFLISAFLSVNSALIVYPAEVHSARAGEVPGDVSISRESVSVSSSEAIARVMNSMPKAELVEEKPILVKSSNQIVFEDDTQQSKAETNPVSGLRGGKLPPKDLEALNSSKSKESFKSSESDAEKVKPTAEKVKVESEPVPSMKPVDIGVAHVEIPLESDKANLHPSYLLKHFLSNDQSEDTGPIILKPAFVQKKSIIAEIAERPCFYCARFGEGLSIGRTAGAAGGAATDRQYRFEDFVSSPQETIIDLDSRELMRRRKNFHRVSSLLPGHRSLHKTGPDILLPNQGTPVPVSDPKPAVTTFPKASRSFWTTMLAFWPFSNAKKQERPQPQVQNPTERLLLAPGILRLKSMLPSPDEDIIIRPNPTPTPKPLAIEDILMQSQSSSSNTFNTMNEIHEELNKQNAVKLQSTEPPLSPQIPVLKIEGHVSEGPALAPRNMAPGPGHRPQRAFRGLLPFYTVVESEPTPAPPAQALVEVELPTRAPVERESWAQISPAALAPSPLQIQCPYLTRTRHVQTSQS